MSVERDDRGGDRFDAGSLHVCLQNGMTGAGPGLMQEVYMCVCRTG